MALTASVGSDFKPITEGTHPARCISVYDLGTQHSETFDTDSHQILLQWELLDEEREFEGEKYRAKVSKTYTLSMNKKSNLRKLVEAWAGKGFTDEEAEAFDLLKLAGLPCYLQTVNKQTTSGKTRAEVIGIMKPPPGTPELAPSMARVQTYEMGQPLPEKLPEWLMEKITSAPEFAGPAEQELPAQKTDVEMPLQNDNALPF